MYVNGKFTFKMKHWLAWSLQEEIKCQPPTFERLASYVRRRIAAREDVPYLSIEDQQDLVCLPYLLLTLCLFTLLMTVIQISCVYRGQINILDIFL